MENTAISTSRELQTIPKTDNQKRIENHKKAATHFKAAAKSHIDAAKHHENENHEKATKSTVEAHGHSSLANEAQKLDIKLHTLISHVAL